MPTPEELDQFGAGLSIWEQLRLFQEWSPLIGFAQRFTLEKDSYARSVVVSEALEWVASKTRSQLDDELVSKVVAIAKTQQGEDLIRWALAKSGAV
jgi:hypothetical protein